jgi:hypothetical protein
MKLPTIETPKYRLTLPSTKKIIDYRPFLVKEEKILLLAQEANDHESIMTAIRDIISACTFNKINIDELTSYDIEYIFLKLRSKSVGEKSQVQCRCEKCETYTTVDIDLDAIEVTWPEEKLDNVIMLTDIIGVTLKHIKISDIKKSFNDDEQASETLTSIIIASIENIFDSEKVYDAKDSSYDELLTFINSLNRNQITKIEEYIANTPKLEHTLNFNCKSCKYDNAVLLSGLQTFFE